MRINTAKKTSGGFIVNGGESFIPNDIGNSDYLLLQEWIANGGIVEPEFTGAELLQQVKDKKITAIKTLRNQCLARPFIGFSGYVCDPVTKQKTDEIAPFVFSTKPTGQPLTEPSNIIFTTLIASQIDPNHFTPYSTVKVIDGQISDEKVIIYLNGQAAADIQGHLAHRSSRFVGAANKAEDDVNNCATVEEVEAINIEEYFE